MNTNALKGLGLLVGMIVGAGMFAFPYTILQAGVVPSVVFFVLVACVTTIIHILYGYVFYACDENHRLPGLVLKYLGLPAYYIVLPARFFSHFGTLLAYGILGGLFLSYLFPFIDPLLIGPKLRESEEAPLLSPKTKYSFSFSLSLTFPSVDCVS